MDTLNDVQERDLALDALDAERADVPEALRSIRAEREALEARLETVRGERDALRAKVREADVELQALRDRTKAAQEAALRAESSKEAAQFQNQEMQFATRAQELEEDTLPSMEALEATEATLQGLEAEHAELVPEHDRLEAEERERLAEIDAREGDLRETRATLAEAVPAALLKQYEQVRKARRGIGLVQLVDGRRCGGCNMQLPLHVVQKVKKNAGVVRCPSCGRILWSKTDAAA